MHDNKFNNYKVPSGLLVLFLEKALTLIHMETHLNDVSEEILTWSLAIMVPFWSVWTGNLRFFWFRTKNSKYARFLSLFSSHTIATFLLSRRKPNKLITRLNISWTSKLLTRTTFFQRNNVSKAWFTCLWGKSLVIFGYCVDLCSFISGMPVNAGRHLAFD